MSTSAQSHDHQQAIYYAHQAVSHAPSLTYEELADLIAQLAIVHAKQTAPRQQGQSQGPKQPEQLHNVMEFKGMAKGLWSDIDVEEYLKNERASWRKREYGS